MCPLGVIQLLQLSSPRLHFVFAVLPHAHVPHLISEGADGLNAGDPVGLGLNLFCSTEQVDSPSLPPSLGTGCGDIWFANQGGERVLLQPRCSALHLCSEPFPGLCLAGCWLWVTMCVMVRLLWGTSEVLQKYTCKTLEYAW